MGLGMPGIGANVEGSDCQFILNEEIKPHSEPSQAHLWALTLPPQAAPSGAAAWRAAPWRGDFIHMERGDDLLHLASDSVDARRVYRRVHLILDGLKGYRNRQTCEKGRIPRECARTMPHHGRTAVDQKMATLARLLSRHEAASRGVRTACQNDRPRASFGGGLVEQMERDPLLHRIEGGRKDIVRISRGRHVKTGGADICSARGTA